MAEGETLTRELTVENKLGLHARAATVFVQTANRFDADIFVSKDGIEFDGKSVLSLMSIGAAVGSSVTVTAKGGDAQEALDALEELFKRKFDEE